MNITSSMQKFILLSLFLFVNNANAVVSATPSVIEIGDTVALKDSDVAYANIDYGCYVEIDTGGGNYGLRQEGTTNTSEEICYSGYSGISNTGTRNYRIQRYYRPTGQLGVWLYGTFLVNAPTPSVTSVLPTSATSGISQTFTVSGSNLPSTIALSLDGSSCGNEFSVSTTSANITCDVSGTGNRRFYVAEQPGGAAISGSVNLYVNVVAASPTVSSVSPLSATSGTSQTFTVFGSNLPSTIAMSLEGSLSCGSPFSVTSGSAKITCTPSDTGSKRFYVAKQAGGAAINGSASLYVSVPSIDNPPTVTINIISINGNQVTANISTSDDRDITRTSFTVFNAGSAASLDIASSVAVTQPISTYTPGAHSWGYDPSTATTTTNWNIDVSGLPDGNYEIEFYATDGTNAVAKTGKRSFTKSSDLAPTVSVSTAPSINGNQVTASISTSDDIDITRTSFTIFNAGSATSLDIASSVAVTHPISTYNSSAYSWGYNPSTATTTTNWNIDVSGLPDGNYEIEFYATDGTNAVAKTGKRSFTKSSDLAPTISVSTAPSINGNQVTASISTSDDIDITRTSFTIFNAGSATSLDIASSVAVTHPISTYTPGAYSWGYNPSTATTTTNWNIDVSGLLDGNYEIEFYATDGVNAVVATGKRGFIKSSSADLNDGLVAYYPFDGNANDSSDNGNHGTVWGGVTYAAGRLGNSAIFGGVNNPGHIYVPNSSSLQFLDGASYSAWLRVDEMVAMDGNGRTITTIGGGTVIAKSHDRRGAVFRFYIDQSGTASGGIATFDRWQNVGAESAGWTAYKAVGDWMHTVVTLSASAGAAIYLDGKLWWHSTGGVPFANMNNEALYIGKFSDRWYPFGGAIDDVRIYNRVLNASEIFTLASMGGVSNLINPVISVRESSTPGKAFTFEVQLTDALPPDHGLFLYFDDQQGGWLTGDGGHIKLAHQGNNLYSLDTNLEKPGIRFFRVAIFDLNGDSVPANNVRVSNWSDVGTCTLAACLAAVERPKNYGNPVITGSGSELFKNVDVAKANYHLAKVDMSVPGKGPSFFFSRAYNSNHSSPWTFAYEMKAEFLAGSFDRQIAIGPREDGHIQYFFKDMANSWHAINPGDFDKLVENTTDGSFVLYTQGNRLYRFASPNATEAGRLQTIEDRLGNALTMDYTGNDLIGVTDANGRSYTITRDGSNRISRVTDFTVPGRYVEYAYDTNGMLTAVRNMRGDAHQYTYINSTFLKDIIDPRSNRQLTIQYLGDGRVEKLIDGNNQETAFIYGSSQQWGVYTGVSQPKVDTLNHNRVYILNTQRTQIIKMYNAKSAADALASGDIVTTRSYQIAKDNTRFSDLGLVAELTDPKLNSTRVAYDEQVGKGKPKAVTNAKTEVTEAAYTAVTGQENLTAASRITQKAKNAGDVDITTQYLDFIDTGAAQRIIDPRNFTTNRLFNANGWMIQSTNPRGNSVNYNYDAYGNLTHTTDAKGHQTIRTPDNLGRLKTEVSPLGLTTTYTYDAHGNVLTRNELAAGINYTTQYSYDASDNLIQTIDPLNQTTNYVYDNLNRKIAENYTVGGVPYSRSYAYDALGRLQSVTNERGQIRSTHYTSRSQVASTVNPLLETITYAYDKTGNVTTVIDAEGRTITTDYDELNRKTTVTDDQGNTQRWIYNTAGQVSTYEDSRGKTTHYEYDATGNLTKLTDPEGGITESTYDGNGNLLTVKDPNLHTTTYAYDELDRRISTTLHDGQQWIYTYDANGNQLSETTPSGERTEQTYDALNRVTQLTEYAANSSIVRQINYTYDANSNVRTESSGSNTISYSYDEINRVTSVTDQYGKTISYGYDKAGNRTTLTYPGNKTINYVYDDADRLKSLTDWLSNKTEYFRNQAGQPIDVVNGNGTKAQYVYDSVGRLTQLLNKKANNSIISSHNLTLDGAGNITQATVSLPLQPALPVSTGTMAYNNNNRILSAGGNSYTHDQPGRIIEENKTGVQTTYNFDINDHITSITRGTTTLSSYGYDLNNNRIQQVQGGVETRYVIDQLAPLPNVVAETDALGNVTNYYLYGEGLVSQISAAGNSHYYHFDPTGHTLALTDASGNVSDRYAYAPYGFTTSQGSTHNPFRFVGKHGVMDDGDGLHYMRARYYKEDIKRFVSLDGLHGDVVSPQSLNRYAYVLGNPVMGVDPSGYYPFFDAMEHNLDNMVRSFKFVGGMAVGGAKAYGNFIYDTADMFYNYEATGSNIGTTAKDIYKSAKWIGGKMVDNIDTLPAAVKQSAIDMADIGRYKNAIKDSYALGVKGVKTANHGMTYMRENNLEYQIGKDAGGIVIKKIPVVGSAIKASKKIKMMNDYGGVRIKLEQTIPKNNYSDFYQPNNIQQTVPQQYMLNGCSGLSVCP